MRAALILAAGRSRRFGITNKLLIRCRGKPLLRLAMEAALHAPVGRVIVMTGADRGRVQGLVHSVGNQRLSVNLASDHHHGHRASLLCGLNSLRSNEKEVLIFLGDMPMLDRNIGRRLTKAVNPASLAVRATHRGLPGHPVLIRNISKVRDRLERGESPFRSGEVTHVEAGKESIQDIDRPGDLLSLGSVR